MIDIIKYSPEHKGIWNEFVESSKNGTFLFNRDYMDYHSHRFHDNSYLIYRKNKLYALLPANIREDVIYSHQGLTYGGLIMGEKCSSEGVLEVFAELLWKLKSEHISRLVYKPVPSLYHKYPSDEDLYALFRNNAVLTVRNISSTLPLDHPYRFNKDRREAVRRAIHNGVTVENSTNFPDFWRILEGNLMSTYGAKPVHTLSEIQSLVQLFPNKIQLWCAFKDGSMIGGMVCYNFPTAIHAQYISASPEGKKYGAVDLIVHHILNNAHKEKKDLRWFDLGTSNEDGGRILNESLVYQKEGFGGRGICYDTYEVKL